MQNEPQNTPENALENAPTAGDVATEAAAEGAQEAAPGLEERLREAEMKAAEHHDAWLRARADAENIRKRGQEDVAKAHKFAVESLAAELLPVRDSLEAALATESASIEALKNGVELTLKQLAGVFEKTSLREINPLNQKFDPHRHQAIAAVPSDLEPNTVTSVLQKGYTLHERVIRPALVTVAKPKDA